MDHSKFEGMEENLKGSGLVEYLAADFEILNKFKTVKIELPTCLTLPTLTWRL
jgi:hypothetical protein